MKRICDATVLILDDLEDANHEITDFETLQIPEGRVPVSLDFNISAPLGWATLYRDGNRLRAKMEIVSDISLCHSKNTDNRIEPVDL